VIIANRFPQPLGCLSLGWFDMKNIVVGLGGLFVTLVLTPLLASWLSALGTELKWFDSPSNQIQFLLEKASALRGMPLYDVVVVAVPSAAFGYVMRWIVKRKGSRPEIATGDALKVTADAVEASRRIGLAIEAIEKAIAITSQGGSMEDQLTYVAGQITATSLSLSALGVQLPTLSREDPTAYLRSYKSLFEAMNPLIETGHFQTAAEFARGLGDRLPEQYLHRPKYATIDVPKLG
jgi:hypothetical protein